MRKELVVTGSIYSSEEIRIYVSKKSCVKGQYDGKNRKVEYVNKEIKQSDKDVFEICKLKLEEKQKKGIRFSSILMFIILMLTSILHILEYISNKQFVGIYLSGFFLVLLIYLIISQLELNKYCTYMIKNKSINTAENMIIKFMNEKNRIPRGRDELNKVSRFYKYGKERVYCENYVKNVLNILIKFFLGISVILTCLENIQLNMYEYIIVYICIFSILILLRIIFVNNIITCMTYLIQVKTTTKNPNKKDLILAVQCARLVQMKKENLEEIVMNDFLLK